MKNDIFIIEGNSVLFALFQATAKSYDGNSSFVQYKAVVEFIKTFLIIVYKYEPKHLIVTWDTKKHAHGSELYTLYTGKEDTFSEQMQMVKYYLEEYPVFQHEIENIRVEDVIGSIKNKFSDQEITILTAETFMYQLINSSTDVLSIKYSMNDMHTVDEEELYKLYELNPKQILDIMVLCGDKIQSLPGVKGIGEKTAFNLLNEYRSIDSIYERIDELKGKQKKLLLEAKERVLSSKEFAIIKEDNSIEFSLKDLEYKIDKSSIIDFYIRKGMDSLLYDHLEFIDNQEKKKDKHSIQLNSILKKMSEDGLKIDISELETLKDVNEVRLAEMKKNIYSMVGYEFNINSKIELAKVLYDDLNMMKNKNRSVSIYEMKKHEEKNNIISWILQYKSAYLNLNKYINPMYSFIDDKFKIHPQYLRQEEQIEEIKTVQPSLGNLGKYDEEGKKIRKCIIASEDSSIYVFKYINLEWMLLAYLSKSRKLNELIVNGEDTFVLLTMLLLECDKKDLTPELVKIIEYIVLSTVSGTSDFELCSDLNLNTKEIKDIINNFYNNFPDIMEFNNKMIRETLYSKDDRAYNLTMNNRRTILNKQIADSSYKKSFIGKKNVLNNIIYGTINDILKMIMVKVTRKIESDSLESKLILINEEHLVFDVIDNEKKEVVSIVTNIMKTIIDIGIPLEVVHTKGDDYFEASN